MVCYNATKSLYCPRKYNFQKLYNIQKEKKTHMHLSYQNWEKSFVTLWKWFFSTSVIPARLKLYTHTSLHQYLENWWLRLPNLNKQKTTNKQQRKTLIICFITMSNLHSSKKKKQKQHTYTNFKGKPEGRNLQCMGPPKYQCLGYTMILTFSRR